MLFRTRKQMRLWDRIWIWFWPRRSFARSFRYIGKRVLRIPATPHVVALGLSIGIFSAFTPFYGLHVIFSMLIAWGLSANVAAAAIGTAFANPLTIPFIFSATYELGQAILHDGKESIPMHDFFELLQNRSCKELWSIFLTLFVGSAILGSIAAILAYILTFNATKRFRRRRSDWIARRLETCLNREGSKKKKIKYRIDAHDHRNR
ncbi:MAG: hypothetical protein JSC085_000100 [Candidatus Tokpelaia sp. JSC085]|nr:MAG: hypothetical protein JSC085_000100 [Candidatus Tokpelaia sp. JSC085]